MSKVKIIDTHEENIHSFGMCGYKNLKNEGYKRKVDWVKKQYANGMKYKILYSEDDGAVGGIEYIPGENAFRPVSASGYMFIHCIYIMSKKYKGMGYGDMMLKECIEDARKQKMKGVSVLSRKGTWMPAKDIFIKNGFEITDKSEPDFELLALKFDKKAESPKFRIIPKKKLPKYDKGLKIFTSDQCPYTEKAVREISETAIEFYSIKPDIIDIDCPEDAQNSPCAFGIFYITYDGKIIADHPISKTRFKNIMNKLLK